MSDKIFESYHVRVSDCYSTSSMAMKIFRTNFQKEDVYVLPQFLDKIIRRG